MFLFLMANKFPDSFFINIILVIKFYGQDFMICTNC
jgi:hypothetical protein